VNQQQQRILLFLDGNAPQSARVIVASTGLASSMVLAQLVEQGLLERDAAQAYDLTAEGREVIAGLRGR